MKRTFHLFSIALVLTLLVSLMQATSAPAQIEWTLTPTEVVDPGPTPTQVVDPGPTPTQVDELPPTPTQVVDPGATPTQVLYGTPTPFGTLETTPTPIGGPIWTVTSTADSSNAIPGNCPHVSNCRLRDALAAASAGDTITFSASLSGQTIALATTLILSKDVTIDGSLAVPIIISGVTTRDGTGNYYVFIIDQATRVNLKGLMITKSNVTGYGNYGGGINVYNDAVLTIIDSTITDNSGNIGGGILNWYGTLIVENSRISNNTAISGAGIYGEGGKITLTNVIMTNNLAEHSGGGIYNRGDLTATNSTILSNVAEMYGGGIYNDRDLRLINSTVKQNSSTQGGGIYSEVYAVMAITSSTISENTAMSGGGITNSGSATVTSSTLHGNSADYGGGVYSTSTLTVTNSTFSNNHATAYGYGYGGGINASGTTFTVLNSTFSGNTAYLGGGVYSYDNPMITNSIFWRDTGGELSIGNTSIVTYNVVQGGYDGAGNLDADPLLGALGDNSSFTQTMALLPGSPAIDAGDDASCPATDQRGMARPQGAHCDLGAYEAEQSADTIQPAVISIVRADSNPTRAAYVDFTVTFSEAVTGVDMKDFALKITGGIRSARIIKVIGSGDIYTVRVTTGRGNGTLRLDVPIRATIIDLSGNLLDSLPFHRGEVYKIIKHRR